MKAFTIKQKSKSSVLFLLALAVLCVYLKMIYHGLESNLMVVQLFKIAGQFDLSSKDSDIDGVQLPLLKGAFYDLADQKNDDIMIWYHIGQLAYWSADYDKVISVLAPRLKEKEFPLASLMLGNAFWEMGNIAEAESSWRSAKNIETYFLVRASTAEYERNYPEAEESYQKLLAISPHCLEARNGYLFVHSINLLSNSVSEPSEMEETVIQALSQNKDSVARQLRLGVALYQAKKLRIAETALQRSIQLEPNSYWPKFYLGLVYFAGGDYPRAEGKLLETVQIAPSFARGHLWLARTMIKLGKNNLALSQYRLAIQLLPDDSALVNEVETFMENMGNSR
jgi:tetratricopeptide (TPR) repeat protein